MSDKHTVESLLEYLGEEYLSLSGESFTYQNNDSIGVCDERSRFDLTVYFPVDGVSRVCYNDGLFRTDRLIKGVWSKDFNWSELFSSFRQSKD